MAERGDYIAPFLATPLFSVTSFVKPAFSFVYGRVSAVASVSASPFCLFNGHQKWPKKVTGVTNLDFLFSRQLDVCKHPGEDAL